MMLEALRVDGICYVAFGAFFSPLAARIDCTGRKLRHDVSWRGMVAEGERSEHHAGGMHCVSEPVRAILRDQRSRGAAPSRCWMRRVVDPTANGALDALPCRTGVLLVVDRLIVETIQERMRSSSSPLLRLSCPPRLITLARHFCGHVEVNDSAELTKR